MLNCSRCNSKFSRRSRLNHHLARPKVCEKINLRKNLLKDGLKCSLGCMVDFKSEETLFKHFKLHCKKITESQKAVLFGIEDASNMIYINIFSNFF